MPGPVGPGLSLKQQGSWAAGMGSRKEKGGEGVEVVSGGPGGLVHRLL